MEEVILFDDVSNFLKFVSPDQYRNMLEKYYPFFLEAPKKKCLRHIQRYVYPSSLKMESYISDVYVKWCIIHKPNVFMFMVKNSIVSMEYIDQEENTYIHYYLKYSYLDNVDILMFMMEHISLRMLLYATDINGDAIFHTFAKNMAITMESDKQKYTFVFYAFVEKGCNLFLKNEQGKTALMFLKEMGKTEEYNFLLELIQTIS